MATTRTIRYVIKDPVELNLSYMPFISNGGIFIPTTEVFPLRTKVTVELALPTRKEIMEIEGKVVWVIPNNALHHVLSGIGVQFIGKDTLTIRNLIEANLDKSMEVGGYTHGIHKNTDTKS